MFFFKSKALSHRQTALIGFVLALLSLLTTLITVFVFPVFGAWLNNNGVFTMDLFLLAFFVTVFLSAQGLILFGFPLYYAQDKKSHMTGFQILLFALLFMALIVVIGGLFMVMVQDDVSYSLEDWTPSVEVMPDPDAPVLE